MALKVKDLLEQVKNNNKRFATMTPKEKRIAVAKDAMAQLLLGEILAESGTYIEGVKTRSTKTVAGLEDCRVCAIGACMLSALKLGKKRFDDLPSSIYPPSDGEVGKDVGIDYGGEAAAEIHAIFDTDTLRCMENAFERWSSDFYAIGEDNIRLFAILENVIEHDGQFVPHKIDSGEARRIKARFHRQAQLARAE